MEVLTIRRKNKRIDLFIDANDEFQIEIAEVDERFKKFIGAKEVSATSEVNMLGRSLTAIRLKKETLLDISTLINEYLKKEQL